eukprot:s614_g4.t1
MLNPFGLRPSHSAIAESAPVVPSDVKEQPVKPLPGLLFPIPAFQSPTGGMLAEPGESFRPRMTLVQSKSRLRRGRTAAPVM